MDDNQQYMDQQQQEPIPAGLHYGLIDNISKRIGKEVVESEYLRLHYEAMQSMVEERDQIIMQLEAENEELRTKVMQLEIETSKSENS